MLINNNYIISVMNELIRNNCNEKIERKKSNNMLIQFVRKTIIFHIIKYIYQIHIIKHICQIFRYIYYTSQENKLIRSGNYAKLNKFKWTAVNFMQYCFENEINFETNHFYSEEDNIYIQMHINNMIKSILYGYNLIPMNDKQKLFNNNVKKWNKLISKRENYYLLSKDERQYKLPINHFEPGIFEFHYGLKFLDNDIKEYIKNKDFLDIGAYIGDSAIVFLNYKPKMIYAYEPTTSNIHLLKKTVQLQEENKICIINKGIGDKNETVEIVIKGSNSSIVHYANEEKHIREHISITTIDDECYDKNIGLIKMDIEGFEYYAINGGLKTIKRDKPVLLISIYHTGKDFFEIPPLIKNNVPEYKFKYVDLFPTNVLGEKILIAYI